LASWAKRGLTSASPAFDEFELGELFAERTQGRTDPDDAPEPPAHPVAEPGDLWVLGRSGWGPRHQRTARPRDGRRALMTKRVGVTLRLQRVNGIVRSSSGPGQYMMWEIAR
jgi:hypothetical protein